MSMSLDEQKLAVCEKLPELIRYDHEERPSPNDSFHYPARYAWVDTDEDVNWPTEGLQVCHEATRLSFQFSIWTCDGGYGITLSNPPEHGNGQLVTLYGNNLLVIWLEALCRVWFPESFKCGK